MMELTELSHELHALSRRLKHVSGATDVDSETVQLVRERLAGLSAEFEEAAELAGAAALRPDWDSAERAWTALGAMKLLTSLIIQRADLLGEEGEDAIEWSEVGKLCREARHEAGWSDVRADE